MTKPLQVIFRAPIATSKTEDRAVLEHGDGRWTIARVSRADPPRVVAQEVTFTLPDLRAALVCALQGDPAIGTMLDKQAGKVLAAGALLLMQAIGLDDEKIDASRPPAAAGGERAA